MKVLLHICCGICAGGAAERLMAEGHEVRGFFYNPNIHPREEYERRLEVARRVATELNFPLEEGPYDTEEWFAATEGLASEPEGGKRCDVCYRLRLQKTLDYLRGCSWDDKAVFTTTLTISSHKSATLINQLGQGMGGQRFLPSDFKKKDGFKRAGELARKWSLYRQDYCGCVYSMRKAQHD